MKRVERARWLSLFDREPFIGAILRYGTLLSVTLIVAALVWWRMATRQMGMADTLEGTNVIGFLLSDLRRLTSITHWPQFLLHVGIAALLLIPYIRSLASLWYFAWVERNARSALFTACTGVVLTYILFFG